MQTFVMPIVRRALKGEMAGFVGGENMNHDGVGEDELGPILDALDLSDTELQVFARALGVPDMNNKPFLLEQVRRLRASALKEFVDWMIGKTRYSSVSESDMHRVIEVFLRVREEAPSVDQLVSELTIPAGRATSLLARMRYGEGRALTELALRSSAAKLRGQLSAVQAESDNRKSVWVDGDIITHIREVAMKIMKAPRADHNKRGKFQGAQLPDITSYGREGGLVKTTTKMWDYIIITLDSGAKEVV
jgi:hypothetical protein